LLESNPRAKVALKLVLVVLVLAVVLGVAGRSIAPSVALTTWLLWCGIGLGVFLVISVVWILLNLQLGQWVLRKGGTDPQWFWFNSEPKGLEGLRGQRRSLRTQEEERRGL
jgi:hypothetical protein